MRWFWCKWYYLEPLLSWSARVTTNKVHVASTSRFISAFCMHQLQVTSLQQPTACRLYEGPYVHCLWIRAYQWMSDRLCAFADELEYHIVTCQSICRSSSLTRPTTTHEASCAQSSEYINHAPTDIGDIRHSGCHEAHNKSDTPLNMQW